MKMSLPTAILVGGLVVSGCTPAKLTPLKMPVHSAKSEILIYRGPAFNAGGASMVFGADESDYITLENGTYAEIFLAPESYRFFVRSTQGDRPYVLPIKLVAYDKKCLRAYANPSNYAKIALLGLGSLLGNSFLMEEVQCPPEETLSKYTKLNAQYQ